MDYKWHKKGEDLLREIRETSFPESIISFWYIGQMGIVLKWKGYVLYLDPVLNDLFQPDGTSRRNYEIPFSPEEATDILAVVGSHNHADHINLNTLLPLAKANPLAKIIIPKPVREGLIAAGMNGNCLVGGVAGESIQLNSEIKITPVAAAHEMYETDNEGNYVCLGYIIEAGGFRIYHAGDTLLTSDLIQELSVLKPYDVAFLPINGVDEERHKRGIIGNMGCRDAVYLSQMIEVDMTIPMHYDMVVGNGENPLIFGACMQGYAPGQKYHIMVLGERWICGR